MNNTLRALVFVSVAGASSAFGQLTTIFSENMGMPSGTTSITSNTFQNSGSLTFSGTGDVRLTTASTSYAGASGSGNVYLTNSGTASFTISGIDVSSYQTGSLDITFGAYKSTNASNMSELLLEFSTNGASFTALTIAAQPTGSGTSNWRLISVDGAAIPATSTLYLRWTNTGTSPQLRLDDVTLTGIAVPEPSAYAALAGVAAIGAVMARRRTRRRAG